jgi:release factor glutamine methyltransferase
MSPLNGGTPPVREAVRWAISELSNAGVLSPRLDSEVLLAHALGWKRARLYAFPEFELPAERYQAFVALVERRRQHEPVPYIVGHREFYGLDLLVDRRVLIPRPETELLVQHTLESASRLRSSAAPWLRSSAAPGLRNVGQGLTLADVGTGSGCVAVSLAVSLPDATVYATDVSADALEVATLNAARHHVGNRVHVCLGDLLQPLPGPVHIIVANLPYVSTGYLGNLDRDVLDYEPRLALEGGEDGLQLARALLEQAWRWLLPHGVIWLEIGAYQGSQAVALAQRCFPAARIELRQDYAHLDRNLGIYTGRG